MQKTVLENIFWNSKMTSKKYFSECKINFGQHFLRKCSGNIFSEKLFLNFEKRFFINSFRHTSLISEIRFSKAIFEDWFLKISYPTYEIKMLKPKLTYLHSPRTPRRRTLHCTTTDCLPHNSKQSNHYNSSFLSIICQG